MPDATLAATALRLIASRGRVVTIETKSTSFNPQTGSTTTADQPRAVRAVFTDYEAREIDGDIVQIGDKKALVAASGLQALPTIHDVVVDGEQTLRVMRVKEIKPGDTAVVYEVQLRV